MKYKDYKLEDVCEYVKERIPIEKITLENYISTENLLPEKGGKQIASSLPKAKTVVSYQKGDTLISNIRPYFKKIWFSNTDGGSSGDILVFRANKKINEIYLYYFLSQNEIFNYMVQTSKGTKMPRGDKEALMQYPIKLPVLEYQKKVSDIFLRIDNKIKLNKSIISNLEELAQTLFKRWFVDFEFPNENGEPYKSSGGKMVESELGMIPERWEEKSLLDIMDYQGGSQPPAKLFKDEYLDGYIRLVQIRDYDSDNHITYIPDSNKLKKCNKFDIMLARYGAALGRVLYGLEGAYNVALAKIIPKSNLYAEYLRCFLNSQNFYDRLNSMGGRSAQSGFNKSDINSFRFAFPLREDLLERFQETMEKNFKKILSLKDENKLLVEVRDTLLPKLLSGEIELPETQEVTVDVPIS